MRNHVFLCVIVGLILLIQGCGSSGWEVEKITASSFSPPLISSSIGFEMDGYCMIHKVLKKGDGISEFHTYVARSQDLQDWDSHLLIEGLFDDVLLLDSMVAILSSKDEVSTLSVFRKDFTLFKEIELPFYARHSSVIDNVVFFVCLDKVFSIDLELIINLKSELEFAQIAFPNVEGRINARYLQGKDILLASNNGDSRNYYLGDLIQGSWQKLSLDDDFKFIVSFDERMYFQFGSHVYLVNDNGISSLCELPNQEYWLMNIEPSPEGYIGLLADDHIPSDFTYLVINEGEELFELRPTHSSKQSIPMVFGNSDNWNLTVVDDQNTFLVYRKR